jgi:hypothetical protein
MTNRSGYDIVFDLVLVAGLIALFVLVGRPMGKTHTSMFFVAMGAYLALGQFFVRRGRVKSRHTWSSEEQKQRMLFGGIGFILLGLIILAL